MRVTLRWKKTTFTTATKINNNTSKPTSPQTAVTRGAVKVAELVEGVEPKGWAVGVAANGAVVVIERSVGAVTGLAEVGRGVAVPSGARKVINPSGQARSCAPRTPSGDSQIQSGLFGLGGCDAAGAHGHDHQRQEQKTSVDMTGHGGMIAGVAMPVTLPVGT